MKTTIEIADDLFRQTKATAALRGESLKDLVAAALRAYLEGLSPSGSKPAGWRRVFGAARREEVEEIDAVVADEFERIDASEWA